MSDTNVVQDEARSDVHKPWITPADEFRHGPGRVNAYTIGATTQNIGKPATAAGTNVNSLGTTLSPEDEFRHGTGRVAPVPLGGTGRDTSQNAAGKAAATKVSAGTSYPTPADEFRHGTGRVDPYSLRGV